MRPVTVVLAAVLVAPAAAALLPVALPAEQVLGFCSTWTLVGHATCSGGTLTLGTPGCEGAEDFVTDQALSPERYFFTPGYRVSYDYHIVTSDSGSDTVDVVSALGSYAYLDFFNPNPDYGVCGDFRGTHSFEVPLNAEPVGNFAFELDEDYFGDLTFVEISNVSIVGDPLVPPVP